MFLPDEQFFGRKGVCPSCGHRFVLTPVTSPIPGLQQKAGAAPQDSQSTLDEILPQPSPATPDRPKPIPKPDAEQAEPAGDRDDEVVDLEELDREDDTLSEPTSISLEQHRQRGGGLLPEEFPRKPRERGADRDRWEEADDLSGEISVSESVEGLPRPAQGMRSANGQYASEPFAANSQAEAATSSSRTPNDQSGRLVVWLLVAVVVLGTSLSTYFAIRGYHLAQDIKSRLDQLTPAPEEGGPKQPPQSEQQ